MYLHLYSFILYLQWHRYLDSLFDHIPECNIVYLVIFTICASPEGCFVHP